MGPRTKSDGADINRSNYLLGQNSELMQQLWIEKKYALWIRNEGILYDRILIEHTLFEPRIKDECSNNWTKQKKKC